MTANMLVCMNVHTEMEVQVCMCSCYPLCLYVIVYAVMYDVQV